MAQPTPNVKHLAASLCNLANANCRMIAEIQYLEEAKDGTMNPTPKQELNSQQSNALESQISTAGLAKRDPPAIVGTFTELLLGLDRLHRSGGDPATEGPVIYCFIKMFQCILEGICRLSSLDPRKSKDPPSQSRNQNKQSHGRKKMPRCLTCRERHLKCDQRALECRNCKHRNMQCDRVLPPAIPTTEPTELTARNLDQRILKLCRTIISMMRYLDLAKATHNEILQGFVFVLFEKVGKGLKSVVFGAEEKEERNVAQGKKSVNEGSSTSQLALDDNNDHAEDAAFEQQAPYLIYILQHVQTFFSQQQQGPSSTTNQANMSSSESSSNRSLATFAQEKLQYTLLKAVFGERAPTTKDYEPALKAPRIPSADDEPLPTIEIPDGDVKEWYKQEVWRLLGWDVLIKHSWQDL